MRSTNKLTRIGRLLMVVAMLGVSGAVRAQDAGAPPPPPPGPPGHQGRFGPGPMSDDMMGFVGFEAGLGGKTVTGAPFSATFSNETKQVLADGNQIVQNTTGTFARDSQGRTRREMTLPALGPWASSGQAAPHVVMLNDPVANTQYLLQPDRKIARKMQLVQHGKRGPRDAEAAASTRFRGEPDQSNVTTTSLGTQTINGVSAEGTRRTRTIPAGAIGNTSPMVITVERWYSPELQTVVMIKRSDPRVGETTFQLTNIQRQEPEASLFQVPADYAVRQGAGARFNRRLPPGAGAGAPPPPQD